MPTAEDVYCDESPLRTETNRIVGPVIGTLVGFRMNGQDPLVTHPRQHSAAAVVATSIVDLKAAHIGGQVLLMFEEGNPVRPIVVGALRTRVTEMPSQKTTPVEIEVDSERLVVSGAEEIVLRCGEASITLTKAGKVLIHGTYVSTCSSGVHRIKGGSVQIN
jgi:hypothetical protein